MSARENLDGKTAQFFICCCSVTKLCPTLCDPVDCSMPGFPVLCYLPEFAQTHVHRVSNVFQPFHPMSPFLLLPSIFPSIRVFSNELALHIRWQSIGASASTSVLPMNIQGWSPLRLTGLISLLFKGLSRVFSSTTVRKHQFFDAQPSLWSSSHIHPYVTTGITVALSIQTLLAKWSLCFLTCCLG